RFATRFGAVDFDDAPARVAADTERDVQADAARGDDLHAIRKACPLLEPHDRAFAVFFLDRRDREFDSFGFVFRVFHWLMYTAYLFSIQEGRNFPHRITRASTPVRETSR